MTTYPRNVYLLYSVSVEEYERTGEANQYRAVFGTHRAARKAQKRLIKDGVHAAVQKVPVYHDLQDFVGELVLEGIRRQAEAKLGEFTSQD